LLSKGVGGWGWGQKYRTTKTTYGEEKRMGVKQNRVKRE